MAALWGMEVRRMERCPEGYAPPNSGARRGGRRGRITNMDHKRGESPAQRNACERGDVLKKGVLVHRLSLE